MMLLLEKELYIQFICQNWHTYISVVNRPLARNEKKKKKNYHVVQDASLRNTYIVILLFLKSLCNI